MQCESRGQKGTSRGSQGAAASAVRLPDLVGVGVHRGRALPAGQRAERHMESQLGLGQRWMQHTGSGMPHSSAEPQGRG